PRAIRPRALASGQRSSQGVTSMLVLCDRAKATIIGWGASATRGSFWCGNIGSAGWCVGLGCAVLPAQPERTPMDLLEEAHGVEAWTLHGARWWVKRADGGCCSTTRLDSGCYLNRRARCPRADEQ